MMQRTLATLAIVTLLPLSVSAADCGAILQGGAFDQKDLATTSKLTYSMARWMCDNKSSAGGSSAGVGIKDLANGYGFDGNSDSWEEWSTSFCEAVNVGLDIATTNQEKVKTASDILVKGFNECIKGDQRGVSIGYALGSSLKSFTLKLSYNPVASNAGTTKISLSGAKAFGCEDVPDSLDPGEFISVPCRRKDLEGGDIVMRSKPIFVVKDRDTVSIAALPTPPDCKVKVLQTPVVALDTKIYSGACRRQVAITARVSSKASNAKQSHERWEVQRLVAGKWQMQRFCQDTAFANANLNCDTVIDVLPASSARVRFVQVTSSKSDPQAPIMTISY